MNATLESIDTIAKNIHTFWLKPDQTFKYIAGQYIEMYLPHEAADSRGQKRWFTLSSSPTEELIAITTKHYGDPISTFKQHLFALKPGDHLSISEPMGDFVLPKDSSIPLIFVVGGIGVTPVRSIVKWLHDTSEKRDIKLIYGARTASDIAFGDVLESYGLTPRILLSQPDDNSNEKPKTIDGNLIIDTLAGDSRSLIYISGPEPLTEKLERELKAQGITSDRLVLDFFPGYPEN